MEQVKHWSEHKQNCKAQVTDKDFIRLIVKGMRQHHEQEFVQRAGLFALMHLCCREVCGHGENHGERIENNFHNQTKMVEECGIEVTLNAKHYHSALNTTPETLNPKPETLNEVVMQAISDHPSPRVRRYGGTVLASLCDVLDPKSRTFIEPQTLNPKP